MQDEDADIGMEDWDEEEGAGEDWDSYGDDESYLDDTDQGGEPQDRSGLFIKAVIGVGVLLMVGIGAYLSMHSNTEDLGKTQTEQIAAAPRVAPGQKVEFHQETKLPPTDTFGVTYGDAPLPVEDEEKKTNRMGLLNNPSEISKIENALTDDMAEYEVYEDYSEQQDVKPNKAAQSATRATTGRDGADRTGMLPMPSPVGMPDDDDERRLQPAARDDRSAEDEPSLNSLSESSSGAQDTAFRDIVRRLDALESDLSRLRSADSSLKQIVKRLDAIEAAQKKGRSSFSANEAGTSAARKSSTGGSAPSWILKAAQPGHAMVSRKGTEDMRSVTVGDRLDGIGRVTAVTMEDGRWVVRGTSGTIHQ